MLQLSFSSKCLLNFFIYVFNLFLGNHLPPKKVTFVHLRMERNIYVRYMELKKTRFCIMNNKYHKLHE